MSINQQQTYWRSLNQLAQNEEYKNFVEREFPENATELSDGYSRRNFLQIMGASIALAGFAACRKPVQKLVPFSRQPEFLVPGKPLYYASSMPFLGSLSGIVVQTNEGRPTKIEGNEIHPDSFGSTHTYQQAAILDLYDPDRSRGVRQNGDESSLRAFREFCSEFFTPDKKVAFLCESNSSQTLNTIKKQALSKFNNPTWVTFEPFGEENQLLGNQLSFGRKLRTINHLDKANIIISLDSDFMGPGPDSVRSVKNFTKGRKVWSTSDKMNRLYVVENTYSLTGSNADHRLRIKSSEVALFTYALASEISGRTEGLNAFSGYSNKFSSHPWIKNLADELISNQGESVVIAGLDREPAIHAAVASINMALGNINNTVQYAQLPDLDEKNEHEALRKLSDDLNNGIYDALVMIGTNPAYSAPADLNFNQALKSVGTSIHLATHVDESSTLATWHVNRAHFLESWGDGYSYTGISGLIQPLIRPLFNGVSEIEFLSTIITGRPANGYDLVKTTWGSILQNNFDQNWRVILHDGLVKDSTFQSQSVRLSSSFPRVVRGIADSTQAAGDSNIELVIKPDARVYDGRYSNNGWLQELPDPLTKITWDNVALMSPQTAAKFDVSASKFSSKDEELIQISVDGKNLEIPVWILPGHAENSITIHAGYGRKNAGRVGDNVGRNIYPIRTSSNALSFNQVSVERTGRKYPIACTQDHHSMEGRPLVRETSLSNYTTSPRFAADMVPVPGRNEGEEHAISLFNEQTYPEHEPQWGMTIDLNSCIGCGVCTIACQAENNIPVIGKREVKRGREMHWIRTDRYFSGDPDGNAQVVHQPIPCMHCELAPCEQVCPVAATTHSDDGLNQMTYNRCVGTRYCANNCPFKVRRFNFFNYPKVWLTEGTDPEVVQMAMNPDVSIRFRGIMEKCTYCVQRISRAKIQTKIETGNSIKPADGMVKTACQQACPSGAIYFGDLTDKNSMVTKTKMNERNYLLLEELNIRPRTSYMAKLRNLNPKLT